MPRGCRGTFKSLLSEGTDVMGHIKNLDIVLRNGGQEAVDAVNRMAADIEAMMPRWIPVGERLPDDYGDVLCWYVDAATGEGHCGFGCCEPNPQTGEREWDIAGVFDQPTHWMPLPEPPA
ncbi:MAG: DUF551 domain-containing protein [Caulobacteraceae bacterium]|nr:DUF551 domain-containing protein [Caulobacteraceae bacterium]